MNTAKVAASTGLLAAHSIYRSREPDPATWERQLAQLARNGFTHLDLSELWLPMAELSADQISALDASIESVGMNVVGVSIIDIDLLNPDRKQASREKVLAALEATNKLHGNFLSLGFHSVPREIAREPYAHAMKEAYPRIGEELQPLAQAADGLGIELSLEMFENGIFDRSEHVLTVIEATEPHKVGANPDLGNLLRAPWPLPERWNRTVRNLAPRINYWHVKNGLRLRLPDGSIAHQGTSVGNGSIDYRSALHIVMEHGFSGPLVIEHYGGDAIEQARSGREYLERLLEDLQS